MNWFEPYGLLFAILLLVPNVIFAVRHSDCFENRYQNKAVETAERFGRFGSFIFAVITPTFACGGWLFDGAKTAYIAAGGTLTILYLIGWVVFRKTSSVAKSLYLSVVPSMLFLTCGVLSLNFPLLVSAAVFAPSHVILSFKNTSIKAEADSQRNKTV